MNDLILLFFKYFAQFVSKEALGGGFIQPDHSRKPGYNEIEAEIMNLPDTHVIPAIARYVFSVNENFISERIKNLKGFALFVEYGKISVNHEQADGIRQTLAITVAHPFSDANCDNPNEVLLMNEALEILDRILRRMNEQQREFVMCGYSLITWPVEIHPFGPATFYGAGGWSAIFTNSFTMI
jgi:hypothetical protein